MSQESIDAYLNRLDAQLARFGDKRSQPKKPSSGGVWVFLAVVAVLLVIAFVLCAGMSSPAPHPSYRGHAPRLAPPAPAPLLRADGLCGVRWAMSQATSGAPS